MQQTIEEIKKQYPDEWLVLGDVVKSEDGLQILAADVVYHGPDKLKLAYMEKPLLQEYKGKLKAVLFNYVMTKPRSMPLMVGGRTIPGTFVPVKPAQNEASI
jgi:hypothetical protein